MEGAGLLLSELLRGVAVYQKGAFAESWFHPKSAEDQSRSSRCLQTVTLVAGAALGQSLHSPVLDSSFKAAH